MLESIQGNEFDRIEQPFFKHNIMPRWNEFDEAELKAERPPPQIHSDTIARIAIGLQAGTQCQIIADCRVHGIEQVVWTKDCAAALVVLELAVQSLRRMHDASAGIVGGVPFGQAAATPTDETQIIPPPLLMVVPDPHQAEQFVAERLAPVVNAPLFFSYDPDGDFELHRAATHAKDAFEKTVDRLNEQLEDGEGEDSALDASWGIVVQSLNFNDRPLTDDEKARYPDWDCIRNLYTMDHQVASVIVQPSTGDAAE